MVRSAFLVWPYSDVTANPATNGRFTRERACELIAERRLTGLHV
jgi:hypothetical protein